MSDDEIFCAALELEVEAEQRELVESLCSNDSQQLQRVWSLLETHRQMIGVDQDSRSILDRPSLVFQAFSGVEDLVPGKRIGKYVLRELIGEGATSLVFRAHQLVPVEREVALKILKPGMDSQRILARFGLEHQVIERLEHAGITPVFDVGVQENGRPFFAMQLVPNPLTITHYAEQFSLELRRRIQMMIATCEIVQHAHQRGVIHRDLKPSNILVEGVPQQIPKPRIIDFGIAKIMQPGEDSASFTTLGDRFGTPAYMSPEQALMPASSVDIRSDIYSLGVVLYELITGFTPHKFSNTSSITPPWTSEAYWDYEIQPPSRVHKLQGKPQAAPTSLRKLLSSQRDNKSEKAPGGSDRELDLIVLKAIAKDRQERYQTVADLQRDLQRFLNGEPIDAAGPGIVYRVKKLINRNRAVSAAVVVTLMTIIITTILTTSYAFRTYAAEQQVRLQLQETLGAQQELLVERDRAEEALRQSQTWLRVFQVQMVTDRALTRFLKHILEAAQSRRSFNQSIDQGSISGGVEVLMKPHERLIVQGDWQWASSRFPSEIVNTSFRLNSREAAQALASSPAKAGRMEQAAENQLSNDGNESGGTPQPLNSRSAEEREALQTLLLEELRLVLPQDDPFIAEVLDNCGLQALDKQVPADAERYLSESVRIWGQSPSYPANLTQSQLFLAEALLRKGQNEQSASMLKEASRSLDGIPEDNPHGISLREFYRRLQTELAEAS